jgi:glycerol-3-phosphate dehydrogenase (NAD(P)+)
VNASAVIGGGAWGTALADLLGRNGHPVQLWAREPDVVASIEATRENTRFLSGARLSERVHATSNAREAVDGATLVVCAVPSEHLRTMVRAVATAVSDDAVVAVATKGIEPGTLRLMTDVVADELAGIPVVAVS